MFSLEVEPQYFSKLQLINKTAVSSLFLNSLSLCLWPPACDIIHRLLPLRCSSYWLTKVELLQTLFCLDLTALAIVEEGLPETVLFGVVLVMLKDPDHRFGRVT